MSDQANLILRNLQYNLPFTRKVSPYLKSEYFETKEEKIYFTCLLDFYQKFNSLPSKEAMSVCFNKLKIEQEIFDNLIEMSDKFYKDSQTISDVEEWLLEQAEEYCKERALWNAVQETIVIFQGEHKTLQTTAIPEIMSKALSVSFDNEIGHDYVKDADKRFEYYNNVENKIPTYLESFNIITNGGIPKKTLNAVISETGGGKSIMLCNLGANYAINGETVLYISLEMAAEETAKRLDANLMDISINDVDKMSKDKWDYKVKDLYKRIGENRIIFRQFPTSSAHVGHFKHLLQELKQKRGFVPTVVIIDYLNICASAKIKNRTNMYEYIKSISEELRALAIELDVVMWTALQFNTEGTGNSDPEITDVAESRGLNHTLDLLLAIINTEELSQMGKVMIKQLKSRYGDKDINKRFSIGIDKAKMRYYDIEVNRLKTTYKPPSSNTTTSNTNKSKNTGIQT